MKAKHGIITILLCIASLTLLFLSSCKKEQEETCVILTEIEQNITYYTCEKIKVNIKSTGCQEVVVKTGESDNPTYIRFEHYPGGSAVWEEEIIIPANVYFIVEGCNVSLKLSILTN